MPVEPSKARLLEAAMSVFLRYGFRKTSMDEVARAAHISRQGLYLHFKTKEELFVATVQYLLHGAQEAARVHLADGSVPLAERLAGACDEVVGRFVGMFGAEAADLAEAGNSLVGDMVGEHEGAFVEDVAKSLRSAGLAAAYKPAGLNARQLADTLFSTALGLKHRCSSREDFRERVQLAARALCAPLGKAASLTR